MDEALMEKPRGGDYKLMDYKKVCKLQRVNSSEAGL
jgi:hypothetical protein